MNRALLLSLIAVCTATAMAHQSQPDSGGERKAMLARGEAALAALDPARALAAFEQAARISHSPDTEMGIIRSSMQAGEYRRALGFAAHTAGAHVDETGATALYAWLLHAGGQEAAARRLLEQALVKLPSDSLLIHVSEQLRGLRPTAQVALLRGPGRLAPYGDSRGLPPGSQVVASATLAGNGRQALVSSSALAKGSRYWVRDGVGRLVAAKPVPARSTRGLSLLQLALPLPQPALAVAPAPFSGSIVYSVEYSPQRDATPAWPWMKAGFVGPASSDGVVRELGIHQPGGSPGGGPVFDAGGRLAGVAVGRRGTEAAMLVPVPTLRQAFGPALFAEPSAGPQKSLAPDAVYEPALHHALQLVRSDPRSRK